jgi:hypothetical protein
MGRVPGAVGPGFLPKGGARKALEMAETAKAAEPGPVASGVVAVAGARQRAGYGLTSDSLGWIGALAGCSALLADLLIALTR